MGASAAFGRIGGILAPMVVGAMLSGPEGAKKIPAVFLMFTAVLVIVALNMIILGDETKQKALE